MIQSQAQLHVRPVLHGELNQRPRIVITSMNIDVPIAGGGPGGLASAESAARAVSTVQLVVQNKERGFA